MLFRSTGYNIYRNDSLINLQPLTEKSFIDDKLLRGVYRYSVTALYDDQSSQHSDEVSGFVKFGIPCYPPAALSAQVIKNKNVNLSWTSPEETGNVAKVLRWDNGVNTNAVGIKGGGTFFAGSLWEYEDLINYRGMEISEVEIIINDFLDALVLCIFKDNDQIYTQGVPSSNIVYGSPVKVVLNEPVIIEPGYSYNIAFRVTHAGDKSPVGLDASAVVEGKGNIISTDGKSWYALTRIGASEGNFNISYILQPGNSSECQQIVIPEKKKSVFVEAENKANFELMQSSVEVPVVSLLSTEAALLGYNIYREGEQINDQIIPENSYSDLCTLPGDYTYNVTSVYSLGESQFSNNTNINILNIDSYNVPYGFRSEVELNRKITLSWGYPTKEVSLLGEYLPNDVISPVSYPTYINSWNATLNSETGVASDGKFLYTSIWNISGMFNKYTLDGQFVETFVIDGVDALRNLTCDGTYFYGGATGSTVFKLDFENKELIETFSVSEIVRHCTYIPDLNNGEGGFEVGDWETSIYVSKSGAKIGTGPSLLGAFGTAYHDGYIYAFEQSSENHYSIGKYDYKTLARVDEINPDYYDGLNITSGMLAGGLSAFTTQEGVVVMGATFQNTQNNKIVLFELDGVSGVEGYNIYCNDEKINDNILTGRMFIDYQYTPGQYAYQIETVYIDEMLSPRSEEQIIDIIQNGVCDSAEPVKIIQSVSGYNLLLSFVNPDIESVDFYENISQFNSGDIFTQEGWINTNESDLKPWKVTSEYSYHGNNSLISKPEENRSDWLITPELNFDSDYVFSFVGRINDNTSGNGSLKIYTSTGSNNFVDFSLKEIVSTEELWKKYELNIDKQVKYIAIVNSENDKASQFVDAISIDKTAETSVFGYDIYRNGEKMNNNPVTTISYFDHNLAPGEYTYQVYTLYKDGCISDLSEPAEFNLEYDLPLAAPESLTAIVKEDGVQLDWSLPAISEAINLGWDSGRNYNAAGLPSGGSFYAGIKFAPEDMLTVKNMCISHAEIFIDTPPDALFLLIYEENKLIYQQYVPEVLQCSFNKINLDTPLQINMEKELKVIFYMEHNSISTPIGFDEGPGVSEKGNLYSTDGINWTTIYDDSYGYIDANWNISAGFKAYQNTYQTAKAPEEGIVFEPRNTAVVNESLISKEMDMVKSSESRRLYGYNVYRNSDRINEEICTNLSYLDQELTNNVYYEYYVTAVYSQNIEVESNRILIVTTGTMDIQNCQSEVILLDDILYIRGVKEGSLIEIYSPSGLIHYRDLADGNVLTYDMSNFADGVYFVRIADSGKVINVKKILK